MSNFILLSYILSDQLCAYGNGRRLSVTQLRSIENGDSSNNSLVELPSHFGTHIDFPKHFISTGKSINSYKISSFIFEKIQIINLNVRDIYNGMITIQSLKAADSDIEVDLLLFNTGYYKIRDTDDYWNNNPGFAPELAGHLKAQYPNLRAIGFDTISLSGFQSREIGRIAHREFLSRDILIIEDMDFSSIGRNRLDKVIVAPLWVKNAEGTPVTVIGVLND